MPRVIWKNSSASGFIPLSRKADNSVPRGKVKDSLRGVVDCNRSQFLVGIATLAVRYS